MSEPRVTPHASRVLLAALVSLAAAASLAGDAPFEPGKDGWLTLFDGSDLAKWKPARGADWALKDGLLAGTKGEIANYWQWLDFELLALCRGAGAIRCRHSTIPLEPQLGYWLDLGDGTLRAEGNRIVAQGNGKPADGWREVRLVASKGAFTVFFDGLKVAEGKDTACPHMGAISLVATGQPLEVRLMRARPLNLEKHANVPARDSSCFVCHANFDGEKLSKKHADDRADKLAREEEDHLRPARQRPKKAGCAGCHGPSFHHRSDEHNVTVPDIMYTRGEVNAACLACHVPHKAETKRKDGDAPPPPNPICTDCHGHHKARN